MTAVPRVLAILQARMSSTRLPGKVLADLGGAPMIVRQIERIRRSRLLDGLVVATSVDPSDDALVAVVRGAGVDVVRGSLDDVLDRYVAAARTRNPVHVARLTGDCPLIDPDVLDAVIAHHLVSAADISTNAVQPTFPDGLDVEVMRMTALEAAAREAKRKFEREHVTPFIYSRTERFHIEHYKGPLDLAGMRWTVDEPEDLAFVRAVFSVLHPVNPAFGLHDVLALLKAQPKLVAINTGFTRNAGLAASIAAEGKPVEVGR